MPRLQLILDRLKSSLQEYINPSILTDLVSCISAFIQFAFPKCSPDSQASQLKIAASNIRQTTVRTELEGKIERLYVAEKLTCYQITDPLCAWIPQHKQSILFGYGIAATPAGMREAREKGLLLTPSEIGKLKALIEDLTIHKAFEEINRQEIQFTPAVKLINSTRQNYGRFITIKNGVDCFVCMSFRRFRELLGILGINYLDGKNPIFELPEDYN